MSTLKSSLEQGEEEDDKRKKNVNRVSVLFYASIRALYVVYVCDCRRDIYIAGVSLRLGFCRPECQIAALIAFFRADFHRKPLKASP